ncbi:MAG: hypothetical protein H7Y43_14575 [Akkermansiaceae bacterium]|nr:hypothetical protein [Verrucomicrobiales bacterium]
MKTSAQDQFLSLHGFSAMLTMAWHLGFFNFANPAQGGDTSTSIRSGAHRITGSSSKKNKEPGDEHSRSERG